jgi:hypothetical protein
MKTFIILISFVLALQPITAEASNFLSGQSLIRAVSGKSLTWYDGSKSYYAEDGTYTFTGKSKISGTWGVRGAWLCVSFSAGKEECARYFYSKGHLFAQNSVGKRFKAY